VANIRDEGGVKGRNNKGIVTYDRRTKKDAFYMYKAHWSDEKFVHITSKRFIDRAEDKISIKVYSNCNEVTLYVNGKEFGSKASDDRVFIFENIELQEGINVVKAVSSQEGIILEDTARFNKVAQTNPSYDAPGEDKGEAAANWFKMPDLSDVEVEEIEITDDVYSTRCTFREIFANEEAKAVFKKYFGNMDESPMFAMTLGMTVDNIAPLAKEIYTDKMMYILNKELTKIKKS
jgi:beta-galactosidase